MDDELLRKQQAAYSVAGVDEEVPSQDFELIDSSNTYI